jgi:hypothetical protein
VYEAVWSLKLGAGGTPTMYQVIVIVRLHFTDAFPLLSQHPQELLLRSVRALLSHVNSDPTYASERRAAAAHQASKAQGKQALWLVRRREGAVRLFVSPSLNQSRGRG